MWKYVKSGLSFSHPRVQNLFQKDLTRVPTDKEEPNEAKKPAHKNWDLIKAFGCCSCSTTHSPSQNWHRLILVGELNKAKLHSALESGNQAIGISSLYRRI
ncbi:hypothetical protein ACJW30_11G190400 [Castanea mollissima]